MENMEGRCLHQGTLAESEVGSDRLHGGLAPRLVCQGQGCRGQEGPAGRWPCEHAAYSGRLQDGSEGKGDPRHHSEGPGHRQEGHQGRRDGALPARSEAAGAGPVREPRSEGQHHVARGEAIGVIPRVDWPIARCRCEEGVLSNRHCTGRGHRSCQLYLGGCGNTLPTRDDDDVALARGRHLFTPPCAGKALQARSDDVGCPWKLHLKTSSHLRRLFQGSVIVSHGV
mmetsp:Transcript_72446/g.235334  ORF Transcript_72446/g.235334 Transcript_72446/m.235334 type:complete len:227 (-) Transcript_72446:70-750(-)